MFGIKLHIAAANGYSKVVEFLLEHQACVDSVDKDLWTPVHAAACWGHVSGGCISVYADLEQH